MEQLELNAVRSGDLAELRAAADRLRLLVGKLISENQNLRFENERLRTKVWQLKREAQSAER